MSRKLDLRTGRTVWQAYRAPRVPVAPLTRDIKTEVLVVGMGISGAMIAEMLTAAGHEVVIIDRRGPLLGSTLATTALVQFEIDAPLTKLARKIGRAKAERAWRRSRLSLSNLAEHIDALGIKCGAARRDSLYLAGAALGPSGLKNEAAARRAAGLGATYLPRASLEERFGIARPGAILSHGNLVLDPRKLTAGLLLKALERKARAYAKVEAIDVNDSKDCVIVSTKTGATITARHVILATGYELMDGVPADNHRVISTWAIATGPQKRALWPGQVHIWEASDPYLYMRTTRDGRVIAGGEDEDFVDEDKRDALLATKTRRISAKVKVLFPQLDTDPAFAWAGSFGTTTTGLPIIGPLPRRPRVFAVMGYGGNGITWSRIAAELVTSALDGREDSEADLFAF
ncbi:MAG: NAD(P)/FAD-dependent oxidoreductase [Rhizobiaceae bacterium]